MFLFLWDPSIDATNWRSEQANRPAVVIRKVCGGNRTRCGVDTQQVLASVAGLYEVHQMARASSTPAVDDAAVSVRFPGRG